MRARRSGADWFLQLAPGTQLHEGYRAWAREERVEAAVVLAGIGMVKDPELGWFDGKAYQRRRLEGAYELVGTQGNVALLDGAPFTHLHVTVAGADLVARAGHLFGGEVHVAHEGHVRVLEGVRLERAQAAGSPLAALRW